MLFHDVGNQILASYYPRLISFSILYYDYIITLSAEIELFWPVKRRLTWPSALFLINRYLSILGHIPVALEMFAEPSHLNDGLCHAFLLYHLAFYALLQFIVAVICIMRIAAIYENNRTIIISFLVLTLGGGAFVATFLFLHSSSKDSLILVDLPVSGCNVESSTSYGQRIALAWGIVLVLDFAVFVLTLYKALRVGWRQPMTIIYVLLRDGSLYFATMFLANLFNILTCLFAPPVLKGVSSVLTSVLCSTLVSRMMINLRQRISSERDLPTEYTGTSVVEESNEIVFDLRASYVDKRFIL